MCLIVFAYQIHAEFPLVLVGNRDEFYARPTRSAHFWADHPDVFAGRDLEASEPDKQGTWMGISRSGRFAAVTNFRELDFNEAIAKRSRGELTASFLCTNTPVTHYLEKVEQDAESYKGFNLLLWENNHLFYTSNRIENKIALKPGIYGLSNGELDSAWPKVTHAKQQLKQQLQQPFHAEGLLGVLMSRDQANDHQLPDTGIDIESERLLSPCFIHSESYGTRASSVLLMHKKGGITFLEQNWNANGIATEKKYLNLSAN